MATNSSPSDNQTPTISGSCLCQSIRYSVTGDPAVRAICHCINCKKSTGSSYMACAFYPRSQFKIIQGGEHIRTYDDTATSSGATLSRQFCGICGSNILGSNSTHEEMIIVTVGSMDDNKGWRPQKELFCRSRLDCIPKVEGAKQFETTS